MSNLSVGSRVRAGCETGGYEFAEFYRAFLTRSDVTQKLIFLQFLAVTSENRLLIAGDQNRTNHTPHERPLKHNSVECYPL